MLIMLNENARRRSMMLNPEGPRLLKAYGKIVDAPEDGNPGYCWYLIARERKFELDSPKMGTWHAFVYKSSDADFVERDFYSGLWEGKANPKTQHLCWLAKSAIEKEIQEDGMVNQDFLDLLKKEE